MKPTRVLAGLISLALLVLGLQAAGPTPARAEQASSSTNQTAAGAITAGFYHSCVLLTTGTVRCWGSGANGRLGYGNTNNIGDTENPASVGDVTLGGTATAISAGGLHSCALLSPGAVRCWGDGGEGQLGYGNTNDIGDTETPASVGNVPLGGTATAITTGGYHTCVLLSTGAVRCWGFGGNGRLGYSNENTIGDDEPASSAGNVPLGGKATAITAGGYHTCALLSTGAVRCWGTANNGQLGYGNVNKIGDDEPASSAGNVPLGGKATAITAGFYHTCALLSTGAVRCWGNGGNGRLGYGNTNTIGDNEPASAAGDVPLGATATAITAGDTHTCALLSTGAVRCWGNSAYGRLGYSNADDIGDNEPASAAGDLDLPGNVTAIEAGRGHTCAGFDDGGVLCWGDGLYGRLGYANEDIIGDDETPATAGFVPVGALVATIPVPAKSKPRLKVKVSPKRDKVAPYVYKTTVKVKGIPGDLCGGKITLKLKRGSKSLVSKKPKLKIRKGTCTAKTTLRVKTAKLKVNKKTKLKLTTTMPGTAQITKAKKNTTLYAH